AARLLGRGHRGVRDPRAVAVPAAAFLLCALLSRNRSFGRTEGLLLALAEVPYLIWVLSEERERERELMAEGLPGAHASATADPEGAGPVGGSLAEPAGGPSATATRPGVLATIGYAGVG